MSDFTAKFSILQMSKETQPFEEFFLEILQDE